MAFIDREREITALERAWQEKESRFFVIYGKRRIGKTELIKKFIKDKAHVYFLAQRVTENDNRRWLADLVGEHFHDGLLKNVGFPDWRVFFEYCRDHINSRIVFVFDEFPYLAEANKGVSSIFQAGWDEFLKNTPVFLILCGSSIAMMESEVLGEKAPLYGRRTGQIFLKPFAFKDARKFFPRASFDRSLEYFSLAGGNASYLKKIDPNLSLEENIIDRILPPDAYLAREVDFVLREELREPRNYFAILKAIALGKNRIGEIVNETGLDKSILHKYLFTLEDLHIVFKEVPVTERTPLKSRKGLYLIRDQYFKFWFRYILPHGASIEEGRWESVLRKIRDDFSSLVAENYERLAADLIKNHEERLFPIEKAGRWWDKNEEIDLVAINEERRQILFGEAKWSIRPVGTDIYERLRRKAERVDWHRGERAERFCLFSKSGFTKDMIELAKKDGIILFYKDKWMDV